jgi:hypothetical protein
MVEDKWNSLAWQSYMRAKTLPSIEKISNFISLVNYLETIGFLNLGKKSNWICKEGENPSANLGGGQEIPLGFNI